MANEPINIFSARADAQGVRDFLLARFPAAEVATEGDTWKEIGITFGEGEAARKLSFRHNRDYYAGPGWPRQKAGMQGYFDRFPAGDRKARLMSTIGTFQFALATNFDPDFDPAGDERLLLLFEVARFLDGVLFTPSSLRDSSGRVLVSADGEVDADATWPMLGLLVRIPDSKAREEVPEEEPEEDEPEPPTAARVALRAVALMGMVGRAVVEREVRSGSSSPEQAEAMRERLLAWLAELGIEAEFEDAERELLHAAAGAPDLQAAVNALWRVEGLVVLAWALGKIDLPRYDELASIDAIWEALGFLDTARVRQLLGAPSLRPREELEAFRKQMLGYNWRLRDFRWSRPRAMDFEAFSKKCWFGSFDVSPFVLVYKDLSLCGERIDRGAPETLSRCGSIAAERHLASNWLCWGPEAYSETDAST